MFSLLLETREKNDDGRQPRGEEKVNWRTGASWDGRPRFHSSTTCLHCLAGGCWLQKAATATCPGKRRPAGGERPDDVTIEGLDDAASFELLPIGRLADDSRASVLQRAPSKPQAEGVLAGGASSASVSSSSSSSCCCRAAPAAARWACRSNAADAPSRHQVAAVERAQIGHGTRGGSIF